jgi:triosephosphate isomerase
MFKRRTEASAFCLALGELLATAPDVDLAICPPFTSLDVLVDALRDTPVDVWAQNGHEGGEGAFTGEVSMSMLGDAGADGVLLGHSERRARQREDSAWVARQFIAAQSAGLVPILCVGEQLDDREAGRTEAVVAEQLEAVLDAAGVASFDRAVVAYEPVWAIGTGLTASPEQAAEVHAFIRARVADRDPRVADGLRILYGGSVKADNAPGLFALPDIDGGLIGGASLDVDSFLGIVNAAAAVQAQGNV